MRSKAVWLTASCLMGAILVTGHVRPGYAIHAISGATCVGSVCTDDTSLVPKADQLYEDGLSFVRAKIAPLRTRPLTVFCSSPRCYQAFGFSNASAKSVGSSLIVLGPNAWKPFYVRHELIHQAQAQELGAIRMIMEPVWFVEGMAYSLSDDPRRPLIDPFEGYRAKFDAWHRSVGPADFWNEAKKL